MDEKLICEVLEESHVNTKPVGRGWGRVIGGSDWDNKAG